MNRKTLISIVVGICIALFPHAKKAYSSLAETKFKVPAEYEQKIIKNQQEIDEYSKKAKAAYVRSQALLDELLKLNGIQRQDGEKWSITFDGKKWYLYKK